MSPALGEGTIPGTATSANALTQAMDVARWQDTWEVGALYYNGDYAEDEVSGETVIVRAINNHTAAAENRPSSADASLFWTLVTGNELLRAERLKAIARSIETTAAPGETAITRKWRGTLAQYQAIANKRDDTEYVTVG